MANDSTRTRLRLDAFGLAEVAAELRRLAHSIDYAGREFDRYGQVDRARTVQLIDRAIATINTLWAALKQP
jgi:hypothetical protein